MSEPKLVHAETREEWRAWLEKHHATETEAWLVFPKKHTGRPRVSYERQERLDVARGSGQRDRKSVV